MASHWGRFTEYGFEAMTEEKYPLSALDICQRPIADFETLFRCIRMYELNPVGEEEPFRFLLNSYVFRTDEERNYIEQGPARLVQQSIQSGRFASCTVEKMWHHYMRRDPTPKERSEVLPQLQTSFQQKNHNLRELVKEIISLPAYRRQP